MRNRQASTLNRTVIDRHNSDSVYLCFEPLMIEAEKLPTLSLGDIIQFGDALPVLYLCQNSQRIALAQIGTIDEGEAIRIIKRYKHPKPLSRDCDSGYSVLETRSASLSSVRLDEEFIVLDKAVTQKILLYHDGVLLSSARLVMHEGQWALLMSEMYR